MPVSVLGTAPSIHPAVDSTTNGDKFKTKFAEQIQWSKLMNGQWRFAWKVAMSHQKETYQSVAQLNYHMSPTCSSYGGLEQQGYIWWYSATVRLNTWSLEKMQVFPKKSKKVGSNRWTMTCFTTLCSQFWTPSQWGVEAPRSYRQLENHYFLSDWLFKQGRERWEMAGRPWWLINWTVWFESFGPTCQICEFMGQLG